MFDRAKSTQSIVKPNEDTIRETWMLGFTFSTCMTVFLKVGFSFGVDTYSCLRGSLSRSLSVPLIVQPNLHDLMLEYSVG